MIDFLDIYTERDVKIYSPEGSRGVFISIDALLKNRATGKQIFTEKDLASIQQNFYELVRYRCQKSKVSLDWLNNQKTELPRVTNELQLESNSQWFGVSGMYGGFAYGLFERKGKPVLITDSWVRVVGGSGQQHEITPDKVELVARGFV